MERNIDQEKLRNASNDKIPKHLEELIGKSNKGKSQHEKEIIGGMLLKYLDSFSKNDRDLTNQV
jgi:hypothetical protein